MAVSGHKTSDFQGSLSKSSAENFENSCNPCMAAGQHIEAQGYCMNCRDYLCKNCCEYHQRLKATKHHQVLDKSNMPRQEHANRDSEVCTENCYLHKNEIIKYFCTQHEELGCTDCITLHHRTCRLDYIPEKCADIRNSDEFGEIMQKIYQKVVEVEGLMKIAKSRDKDIDINYDNIMKDVIQFRKEINDRLDQLQKKIQADADKKKSTDKQTIQSVLATCSSVLSEINKVKISLQNINSSGQNGQLYIGIKRAKSNLNSHEVERAEQSLAYTDMQYEFERHKVLESVLSKENGFGNLKLSAFLLSPRKKKRFDKLTDKDNINIRTKSDRRNCSIMGSVVLSSNKLVLSDSENKKLKVVDTQNKSVLEEKPLDVGPYDIALLPMDQIAVTVPDNKEILILTTGAKLLTVHRISVKGKCRGIDYNKDHLYVVCWDPNLILILDTQGNVQNTIVLHKEIFDSPNYILFSETSKMIYISNFGNNSVVGITLQGEISAIYKHSGLRGPVGMVMLDDGALLVSCNLNRTIHHISGDLKQGQTVESRPHTPQSICYDRHQQEVYIGSLLSDHLEVFHLQ